MGLETEEHWHHPGNQCFLYLDRTGRWPIFMNIGCLCWMIYWVTPTSHTYKQGRYPIMELAIKVPGARLSLTHHGEASKPEKAWAGGIYAAARLDEWTAESKPAPVASRAGSSRAKCTIPGTFVPKESLHRLKDSYMKSTCRDVYTCKSGDRACKSKLRPWDYSVQTLGEGTLWSWLEGASLTHRLEALTL